MGGRPVGWGVAGTGAIVRDHMLAALSAGVDSEVVGVVSADPARATRFAADAGVGAWRDLDAMLDDQRVDAVYVATSHDRHAELALRALRAGKHVLCEKPLATSLRDAQRVVAAANDAGRVLAINHPLRGLPSLRSMRAAVSAGAIGRPLTARFAYAIHPELAPGDWHRVGPAAGVLLDISIHTIDCARFILGTEITDVRAIGTRGPGWDADHTVMLQLETSDGALVSTCDSLAAAGARNGIEIVGESGVILGDGVIGGLELSSTWELHTAGGMRANDAGQPAGGLFAPTLAAFAAAVAGEAEPLAPGSDHLRTLDVILTAFRQLRN